MLARKEIKRLEALIDALEDCKNSVEHNRIETEIVIDRIINYQVKYKKLTGDYYRYNRKI